MSFPGRTPMAMPGGMPGMAPRMMTPGYAFASMGMPRMNTMMPMQMGMMTPMMPPMMQQPQMPMQQQQQQMKSNTKFVPQEIPKTDAKGEKPPITTVFVGNISERAPDMMIKQMLQRCGNVLSWKRVQGASGKLQAFGFCEYEDPEATLRCIRLLNDWPISNKNLVVKVDAKTKTLLDDYRKKKQGSDAAKKESDNEKKEKEEDGEEKEKTEDSKTEEEEKDNELDENTKREDRVAHAGLEAIMREYAFELAKEPAKSTEVTKGEPDKEKQLPKKDKEMFIHAKDTGFDDMEMEDEKREIINREINKFRDRHKDDDEEKEKDHREKERSLARERERRQEEKRQRERLEKLREQRDRERERSNTRVSRSKSRSASPVVSRSRRRSRSRERSSRDRSRERRKEREIEEEEELYERRKLEKKLREKEAAYQERLKNWEGRERKKSREYEKESEREDERKVEEGREARRLKEFLEDYDDLRDDPKFYKGSALQRRLKEREKEKELDNRDRQREKEEFEEIKRKLFDEGHPDAETEVARMEREREEHLQPRLHLQEIKQPPQPAPEPSHEESESDEEVSAPDIRPTSPKQSDYPQSRNLSNNTHHQQHPTVSEQRPSPSLSTSPISTDSRVSAPGLCMDESSQSSLPTVPPLSSYEETRLGIRTTLSLAPGVSPDSSSLPGAVTVSDGKRKKLTVGDVFNQDDDDSNEPKKRKLIPLDYDDEKSTPTEKKGATAEEKRQKIKQLIENIPTAKDELYAYTVDWDIVDQGLMDKRIKPWVTKKIVEYIGEEEPTLTEFICQKVIARSTPQSIQNDVAMILDEEAEVFVVKMWRLLVYETEAKKMGLSHNANFGDKSELIIIQTCIFLGPKGGKLNNSNREVDYHYHSLESHLSYRTQEYRILGKKGEGTFSEVLKCQVIKDGTYRACKKMKQTYESIEQVNNLREIQAMRRLAPHPNVLELQEVIFDKKSGTLVLVCELMDMNVYEMIRGKKHFLPEDTVKAYMYQLVKSIEHMHRNGIFHRDVKPENILIKEDVLKLADFGSCRSVYSKQPYTEYISTRWYRAPECLLTDGYYNYKMDIWSVGCVFYEILSLHPLFPGSNEVDQISKIHDILGTPDPSVLNKLKRSRGMNFNFPPKKGSGIDRLLTHVSSEAIELIYLMCTYDPDDRITAKQALRHSYFKELRDADKRAALLAKQRKAQQKENKEASESTSVIEKDDNVSEKIAQLDEDPSSPLKSRMTEITMYPTLPKAQSHPTQPFKERRRGGKGKSLPKVDIYASETDEGSSKTVTTGGVEMKKSHKKKHKHKRMSESHQYPHHTGLLPRVPMNAATFNPTFHTSSFPTSFNKLHGTGTAQSLLPTINNAYKPHKSPTKPSKPLYNHYTLPSLDQRRY